MDYEKKYKNLLAKAKEFEFQGYIDEECLYDMFPELREESEDERIRKALIKYYSFDKDGGSHALDNITPKQIVTWLKKQGETFTKKDVDDAYLRGISDTKNEIEKQYEANYQIRKDIATFLFNYRGDIKDRAKWIDYLGIKVSFVEEQGEQKKTPIEGEFPYDNPSDTLEGEIENIWGKLSSGGRFSATKEGFREVITHFANYIKEQDDRELVEQKTEWSEEDETVLNNLIYALANDRIGNNRDEYVNWLKSLKDREQPKQEWSKEEG